MNLPVKNLNRSIEFFTELGFSFNQQFTDETATCMIVTDDIFVMLLTEEKFKTFTPREICDAKKYTEVLVCLALESRARVDEMVRKAVAAGGTIYNEPQDHGFMYGHGFQDLDGHIWELIYMERDKVRLLIRAMRKASTIPNNRTADGLRFLNYYCVSYFAPSLTLPVGRGESKRGGTRSGAGYLKGWVYMHRSIYISACRRLAQLKERSREIQR